jgi:hypothetical protein
MDDLVSVVTLIGKSSVPKKGQLVYKEFEHLIGTRGELGKFPS